MIMAIAPGFHLMPSITILRDAQGRGIVIAQPIIPVWQVIVVKMYIQRLAKNVFLHQGKSSRSTAGIIVTKMTKAENVTTTQIV